MSLKFYPFLLLVFFSLCSSRTAVGQDNIALGMSVTASSIEGNDSRYIAPHAVDGDMNTRWSTIRTDNQWIAIDLLKQYDFTEVKLFWEAALGKDYNMEVSEDGINCTVAEVVTGNTDLPNTISLTGHSGRYIRMYGLTRGNGLWLFAIRI